MAYGWALRSSAGLKGAVTWRSGLQGALPAAFQGIRSPAHDAASLGIKGGGLERCVPGILPVQLQLEDSRAALAAARTKIAA